MSKCLIVFYSRTANTRRIAEEIAKDCGCDIETIHEARPRGGVFGYFRSAWEARQGIRPTIAPALNKPSAYEAVLIGTPVWAWSLSSPVRSYVRQHAGEFKRVAFFCTMGGAGAERAFAQLEALCGKKPLATLAIDSRHLAPEAHREALARFGAAVKAAMS